MLIKRRKKIVHYWERNKGLCSAYFVKDIGTKIKIRDFEGNEYKIDKKQIRNIERR